MNKFQKCVLKAEVKPNCFLLFSASQRPMEETFGAFWIEANVSFLYDAGKIAVEWEPEHGPIRRWYKCDKVGEKAKEHFYYDFVHDRPLAWSQLAVEREELPEAAVAGDYDYIFEVLKEWAKE